MAYLAHIWHILMAHIKCIMMVESWDRCGLQNPVKLHSPILNDHCQSQPNTQIQKLQLDDYCAICDPGLHFNSIPLQDVLGVNYVGGQLISLHIFKRGHIMSAPDKSMPLCV